MKTAIFAGGCFWCMEPPFEALDGVHEVVAGYTGGTKADPDYQDVSGGRTGHVEAIRVTYDPSRVSYEKLLDVFWRQIDPTDEGGQFADRGTQYGTAIFYHDDEQKKAAESSRRALDASGRFDKPVVTKILPAGAFYEAEEYHQDYYKKNPARYGVYAQGSGRKAYIENTWEKEEATVYGKPAPERLREVLDPMQYRVTQENGTEPPFRNEYWDNKARGIYVDIVSGEPLFISTDKFDSGTGWPSFTKPLEPGNIVEKEDRSLFSVRTEVRSKHADSHLGHVFDDGPAPTGLRYCINSAALRFIPVEELESQGYGKYRHLFN